MDYILSTKTLKKLQTETNENEMTAGVRLSKRNQQKYDQMRGRQSWYVKIVVKKKKRKRELST